MTAKEIHDNLLSLFIRGLGVWLLYDLVVPSFYNAVDYFRSLFFPVNATDKPDWRDLYHFFVYILPSVYFILGAPPFLKWATRSKITNE